MNFDEIYQTNAWTGKETRSGPGSSLAATTILSLWLPSFVESHGITSLLDLPCGEGKWMPDIPGYIGADIVSEAVVEAKTAHPDRDYRVLDGRVDPLPKVDAIFSRDCMQHLSVADGERMLDNFVRSGAKYLILSHYCEGENTGPESSWHAYSVNLVDAPFNLGIPLLSIEDGYDEDGEMRDSKKMIAVWKIR